MGVNLSRRVAGTVAATGGALLIALSTSVMPGVAQGRGGRGQAPAAPAGAALRSNAPLDLTGYWVSVVTEDWRWRMITAPKGDYRAIPYNAEGRRVSEAWDLAKDNATGQQCKAFGAAGLMRLPTRLHITWVDDNTLKIESDAGQQTRIIHLIKAPTVGGGLVAEALTHKPAGPATWQGYSVGIWDMKDTNSPKGGTAVLGGTYIEPQPRLGEKGSLKVVTVGMKAGYLRKNGVPYSENTVLTEYFDRHTDYGSEWFTVTTVVDD